ncbi:MAG: hypothetical protein V5A62_10185 [Haloarculaceae archaeon]
MTWDQDSESASASGSNPDRDPDPPVPGSRPAGYDEEDPYEAVDLSTLPDWWREAVERFREHGMRPYRPPRFADDELVPPTVADLESELGVSIELRSTESGPHPGWALWVCGERVATLDRSREADGHTAYGLSRESFEALVREAAECGDEKP